MVEPIKTETSTYDTVKLQQPYKKYVLEEQVKGNQPMDFQDWAKSQGK